MTTTCIDKALGIEVMNKAIAVAKTEIEKRGGQLAVKKAPAVTSSKDDSDLLRMLSDLEAANADVSGDEDSDEDEDDEDDDEDDDKDDDLTKSVNTLGLDDDGIGVVGGGLKREKGVKSTSTTQVADDDFDE
jgi:hypothetical protein